MSPAAAEVISVLKMRDVSLGTAESLTGGLLGAAVTSVPGASAVYLGGFVAYATSMKSRLLGIDADLLGDVSVVSEDCARLMAVAASERTGADWTIAVTGVAGPDGQDGHEPGEVWVAVAGPVIGPHAQAVYAEGYQFEGDRDAVRKATVDAAFEMLLRVLAPG